MIMMSEIDDSMIMMSEIDDSMIMMSKIDDSMIMMSDPPITIPPARVPHSSSSPQHDHDDSMLMMKTLGRLLPTLGRTLGRHTQPYSTMRLPLEHTAG